jgi:hypothetical protein
MTPYVQGYCQALVKLGLSPSAGAAAGGMGAAGLKTSPIGPMGKPPQGISKPPVPKPPKPGAAAQYSAAPKVQGENAWQHAQKDLDVGESRAIGKVDRSQTGTPLSTGSV